MQGDLPRRKQIGQQTEQGSQSTFRRSGVNFVLRELGKSKAPGTCSIPRLVAGTQKSFDDRRRQSADCRGCRAAS